MNSFEAAAWLRLLFPSKHTHTHTHTWTAKSHAEQCVLHVHQNDTPENHHGQTTAHCCHKPPPTKRKTEVCLPVIFLWFLRTSSIFWRYRDLCREPAASGLNLSRSHSCCSTAALEVAWSNLPLVTSSLSKRLQPEDSEQWGNWRLSLPP